MITLEDTKHWVEEPIMDKKQVQALLNAHPLILETESKQYYHFKDAPKHLACRLTNDHLYFSTNWEARSWKLNSDNPETWYIDATGTMPLNKYDWQVSTINMMIAGLWNLCQNHDQLAVQATKEIKKAQLKIEAAKIK